jgi:hypothetical protein
MKQGSEMREAGPFIRRTAIMLGLACVFMLVPACAGARAQEISLGQPRPVAKQHIALLSDLIEVQAGKTQTVELRFRVDPGFHINSHDPKDETLIPTVLLVDSADGVQAGDAVYPVGVPFHLSAGAGETLDVYQGEFRVTLRLTARKGASSLIGGLRYQACDHASCFPPRTLPVRVAVNGR